MDRKAAQRRAAEQREAEGATANRHIDQFIDDPRSDAYAVWIFLYFRLPALLHARVEPFMRKHKLFCTWRGKRYRVTGASRMGDVWLSWDFARDVGYDERVFVDNCSEWSDSEVFANHSPADVEGDHECG